MLIGACDLMSGCVRLQQITSGIEHLLRAIKSGSDLSATKQDDTGTKSSCATGNGAAVAEPYSVAAVQSLLRIALAQNPTG